MILLRVMVLLHGDLQVLRLPPPACILRVAYVLMCRAYHTGCDSLLRLCCDVLAILCDRDGAARIACAGWIIWKLMCRAYHTGCGSLLRSCCDVLAILCDRDGATRIACAGWMLWNLDAARIGNLSSGRWRKLHVICDSWASTFNYVQVCDDFWLRLSLHVGAVVSIVMFVPPTL